MSILPLTPKLKLRRFGNGVVLESKVKLAFFVRNGQSERRSEFDTPKWEVLNIREVFAKTAKVQGVSEVSPKHFAATYMRGYRKLHINKTCLAMGMHFSEFFLKRIDCLNPKRLAQVVKA
jgi:hypothetical protein